MNVAASGTPDASVVAPALPSSTRAAGRVWAVAGCGLGGGFFAGALIGGGFPLEVENVSTIIEATAASAVLTAGAAAFAHRLVRRVRLSAIARWGLAVLALSAGLLVGLKAAPGIADDGPDDLSSLIEPGTGLTGLILLGATLLTALILSLRRFPPPANPEHEPSIEELVYGRRR